MDILLNVPSPGDLIKDLLSERSLTQADLAIITGFSRQTINYIISGRTNITPEIAVILATAFGNDADYWLQAENRYRLTKLKRSETSGIEKRAAILQLAPVRDMQKRGWIKQTSSFEELEAELKRFFGADDLQSELGFVATYRKSLSVPSDDRAVRAWCFRAKQLAKAMIVGEFKEKNLSKAEKELTRISAFAKETYRVPQVLSKYGIRYVVLEHLPHTKIDGAAFWLDESSPVIAMSIRFDRIDSFWFTLMHEFSHIKNKDALSVDHNLEESVKQDNVINNIERRANENAAASLINPEELESFIGRVSPLYSRERIIQFAHRIKVHPGIIVGQLHSRKEIGYNTHRQLLAKVRDVALETALTDGWGKALPSGI